MGRDKDKVRLFIGVRVSLNTVKELTEAMVELRRSAVEAGFKVKWVAPAAYHVTLKFVGWTRPAAIEAIRDTLDRELAGSRGFTVTTCGMGAFPSSRKARVLWAGVDDPDDGLGPLAKTIEDALEELGYKREKRPFHAHVTVGRLREVANVGSLLLPLAEQKFSETRVKSILLYESIMKPSGSEYHVCAEWKLEPPSKGSKRQTEKLKATLAGKRDHSGGNRNGPDQGRE